MSDKPNTPQSFDVKIEVMVPMTITYRVTANSAQEALKEADKHSARKTATAQHMHRRIKLKATVYLPNSNMIKYTKTFRAM